MLAVSEDATAAQLMGIRPQRMQALAWAMAGAATGIAGALIANFFYTSPTVGETLAIIAFVTVSFGGFGSVLGALVAGLIIGVVESLSAYLDRAGLQGRHRLRPVRAGAVVPAAGPDGQGDDERYLLLRRARSCWCWPIRCWSPSLPVYERLGALVLLAAIGASAWNIVGGYAGQVSVGHAVFFGFGAYSSVVVYTHLGWPPIAGAPLGMAAERAAWPR